jgi:hypothetical protein
MRALKSLLERRPAGTRSRLLGLATILCVTIGASASPAFAEKNPLNKINKAEFAKFINCPIHTGKACIYGETLEGEFKLGSKATPIVNPTILQGGFAYIGTETLPITPPLYGAEELSAVSQPIPGGLTGASELIGGPASATAELAGTPYVTAVFLGFGHDTAVELPIKVHLENELLGPNCYIGSDSEPIVLKLTDGTTKPPSGVEPMTGKIGINEGRDKGRLIAFINNTLVDNTFAVPAAKGCGTNALLEPIITAAVNAAIGLPSEPGVSHAILTGNQFSTQASWVEKYDKKLLKQKAKEEAGK